MACYLIGFRGHVNKYMDRNTFVVPYMRILLLTKSDQENTTPNQMDTIVRNMFIYRLERMWWGDLS